MKKNTSREYSKDVRQYRSVITKHGTNFLFSFILQSTSLWVNHFFIFPNIKCIKNIEEEDKGTPCVAVDYLSVTVNSLSYY